MLRLFADYQRCAREIQSADRLLRQGHKDIVGLCLALRDWTTEQRMIMSEIESTYRELLAKKDNTYRGTGFPYLPSQVHTMLHPFQRDITAWGVRKGKCAFFADTGLGKTLMQVEWTKGIVRGMRKDGYQGKQNVIAICPLSVAQQTVAEGKRVGINIVYDRVGKAHPFTITNYEMFEKFDPADFGAVILDESSILKALSGKTRKRLTDAFAATPYKLCCTATPAPNDIAEICNHAEFLGIARRVDILATFFVHDDTVWRLKRHAVDNFYRWLASWSMSIKKPSDLGYSDEGYDLPGLDLIPIVTTCPPPKDKLFWTGLKGIQERVEVRSASVPDRLQALLGIVAEDSLSQWIVWCNLNEESKAVALDVFGAQEITGSMSPEEKMQHLMDFKEGNISVVVTKPKIAGFGVNLQNCHNVVFFGLSDSWESFYQCIRRCYRYGQQEKVKVYVIISDAEVTVLDNIMRKDKQAEGMAQGLLQHVRLYEEAELRGEERKDTMGDTVTVEKGKQGNWTLVNGDSCEVLLKLKPDTIGLSVFSPPFMSLYTYSPTARDIGNSKSEEEFFSHFGVVVSGLLRATMPGRLACVHVSQVPAMLVRDGYIGMKDMRGRTIVEFEQRGWIYQGEVCIDKDPQAQAIRTRAKGLAFSQLHKDASWLRPCLADYVLVFRKPGDNPEPILPDITNEEWIEWARPIWYGINETETLNTAEAKSSDDERHICPLQLGVIKRCVRLWSNKNNLVLDPFSGIGSTGYIAVQYKRRYIGVELKPEYFNASIKNMKAADKMGKQGGLFD
jgi:DNA modification methylase